jgi:hypothetical protein
MQVLIIALMSIVCIVALLYCFLGSRYFRAIFTLTAFLLGLLAAYLVAGIYFTTIFARVAITLTGGLIVAIIFNQLQFAGRFLAGVFAGFAIGILCTMLFNISDSGYFWDAVLLVCLALGISGAVNKTLIIRISTAVFGAFLSSLIVFFLIFRGVGSADFTSVQSAQDALNAVLSQYKYMIAGSTAFLTLAGVTVQFFLTLGVRPAKDIPAYMYLTPPLLEDPEARQNAAPSRYIGKHIKLDQ